jgi:hypothetical protein
VKVKEVKNQEVEVAVAVAKGLKHQLEMFYPNKNNKKTI